MRRRVITLLKTLARRSHMSAIIGLVPFWGMMTILAQTYTYQDSMLNDLLYHLYWLLGIVLAKLEGWKVENIVNNDWIERLRIALTARQKNGVSDSHVARVVLRSVFLSRSQYRAKLLADQDAAGQCESKPVVDGVLRKQKVPTYIWMVEFSLPHLFPVNERKLGEIVLSAQAGDHPETRGVLFVRLPSRYLIPNLVDGTAPLAAQSCLEQASQIISHMPCFRFAGAKRVG